MEYTAVRYPTKEYRQYRPGSKGLNVHYRAFREQFYGNKAIIKHSFREIHRNPSVGQYTDQRGVPTYAYKIPNGKMYKTAPLMARIPRGGSVPRVVGSLGDVQGTEFFTEGIYQPLAAAGQTMNSPFLFGKASQYLQDASAQYQAQTGKPVNVAVIKSKEFSDFYSIYTQNRLAKEDQDSYLERFNKDFQQPDEISKLEPELDLVNPAILPPETQQANEVVMGDIEGLANQNVSEDKALVVNSRISNILTNGEGVAVGIAENNTHGRELVLDAGNYRKKPFDRLAGANQEDHINFPGPLQVFQINDPMAWRRNSIISMVTASSSDVSMGTASSDGTRRNSADSMSSLVGHTNHLSILNDNDPMAIDQEIAEATKIITKFLGTSESSNVGSRKSSNVGSRKSSSGSSTSSEGSTISNLLDENTRGALTDQGAIRSIEKALTQFGLTRPETEALTILVTTERMQKLFPGHKGQGNALADYFKELEWAIHDQDKALQRAILRNILELIRSKKVPSPPSSKATSPSSSKAASRRSSEAGPSGPFVARRRSAGDADDEYSKQQKINESGKSIFITKVKRKYVKRKGKK